MTFQTPLSTEIGTPFQKVVWEQLRQIPVGETRSYKELAIQLGKPTAARAVAQANGANQIALLIPCHRVINTDGQFGTAAKGLGVGARRSIKKEVLLHASTSFLLLF